ncbi:metallophosphoesterase family protein [Caldimonas sp. KR1-144]|uniref:metallophosphoesterase family protein n=1 Tax=Caldimonas sp. KR1-144 TaxID=3400911 RepID=UPI003C119E8A
MRIAVVSDIHGNLPALEAVHAAIEAAGVDLIVNLGDIASGPLWPAETIDWLMARDWPTIAGNHERQVLAPDRSLMSASDAYAAARLNETHRAWLASLPPTCRLDVEVWCCHGTPKSDLHYLMETVTPNHRRSVDSGLRAASAAELSERLGDWQRGPALVLCGHTHVAHVAQVPGGPLVVNPGSVGLQAYDDIHPMPHVVQAGSPHARWALLERSAAGWQAALQATTYDWHAAADQAERNGRGDWADALRSGWMGRYESDLPRGASGAGAPA